MRLGRWQRSRVRTGWCVGGCTHAAEPEKGGGGITVYDYGHRNHSSRVDAGCDLYLVYIHMHICISKRVRLVGKSHEM